MSDIPAISMAGDLAPSLPVPEIQARTLKERADILADAAALDAINAATRARFGLPPVVKVLEAKTVPAVKPVAAAAAVVKPAKVTAVKVKAEAPERWLAERASEAEIKDLRARVFGVDQRGFREAVRRAAGLSSVTMYQLKSGEITVNVAQRLRAALAGPLQIRRQGRPPGSLKRKKATKGGQEA